MEKTGGLDAGVSSPHRAEQAVYPKVITVTGESSSTAEREQGAGETKRKAITHAALEAILSHLPRKLLEEHSTEKKKKPHIHTHTQRKIPLLTTLG